jgi:hypothetical protein
MATKKRKILLLIRNTSEDGPEGDGILMEDGVSFILDEDGNYIIME